MRTAVLFFGIVATLFITLSSAARMKDENRKVVPRMDNERRNSYYGVKSSRHQKRDPQGMRPPGRMGRGYGMMGQRGGMIGQGGMGRSGVRGGMMGQGGGMIGNGGMIRQPETMMGNRRSASRKNNLAVGGI